MRYLKRDQNIIVWGGGNVGLRIIKRFSADYNIRFIVDNKLPMELSLIHISEPTRL